MDVLKKQFFEEVGVDLTDHEIEGKFPYWKDEDWSTVARGKGWQMYAEWLEKRALSLKQISEIKMYTRPMYPQGDGCYLQGISSVSCIETKKLMEIIYTED